MSTFSSYASVCDSGAQYRGVPMLVDDPTTNALDIAYEAPPERLVVLDEQLNVVFASGQGPFQYSVPKLAAFVKAQLGE